MYILPTAAQTARNLKLTFIASLVAVSALLQAPSEALAQSKRAPASRKVAQQQASPAATPAPAGDNEKLDVSDLEKRYWAAKDSEFNVVQNRLFSKAGRFALTGGYGNMLNDPWSDGPTTGASLAYFLSERWGIELQYSNTDSVDNKASQQLKLQSGYANHNKMKGFYGASVVFVPFYAKMSVLNSSIMYFDMSVSAGAGVTEYAQQREEGALMVQAPTLALDLTQHFFLTRWFALRVDFKNRFFQEDIAWYRESSQITAGSPTRIETTNLNHTTLLMFGLTLYY